MASADAAAPVVTRDSLAAQIYLGVKDWIDSHDVFKRLNPQANIVPYQSCASTRDRFVVYVQGYTQVPLSCQKSLCKTFGSDDCDMLVKKDGVVEISVPYKAVAPPTPEEIKRQRGLAGLIDDLTQPTALALIIVALVFVFAAFLFMWYVTPQEKDRMFKGVTSWALSWFYRIQAPPPVTAQNHAPPVPSPPPHGGRQQQQHANGGVPADAPPR